MISRKQSCVIDDEMLRLLSPALSSYYQRRFHSLFTFSRHHAFAPRGLLLFEKPANNFSFFESSKFLRCVIPAISVIDHQYFLDLPASHTLAILAAYHLKWSSRRAYQQQEQWPTTATTLTIASYRHEICQLEQLRISSQLLSLFARLSPNSRSYRLRSHTFTVLSSMLSLVWLDLKHS